MENREFLILVKGSGDTGKHDYADAVLRIYEKDGKLHEEVFTDEDGLLDCLSSSKKYMSYLTDADVVDYIRKDGGADFYSVKVISEEKAHKVKEDPYNWED